MRIDSTEAGADDQAARVAAELGGRAVPLAEAEALVAAGHDGAGDGPATVAVAAPPARLAELLGALAAAGLPAAVRALLGSGDAALPDDDPARVDALRSALLPLGGQVVVRRATPRLADVVWPQADPVAHDLARAVRHRLDPAGVLAPGRVVPA